MGLFGSKKNRFIGVDFGTSAIKVVELSYKNQKPYLENYGWFDLAGITQGGDLGQQAMMSYDEKFKMALVSLLNKMNLQGRQVNVAIAGFSGLVVLIDFPNMSDAEIEKAIEFEARKYIPTSIEEVSISWEIVKNPNQLEGEKSGKKVLLVAAPKKEVQRLGGLFEGSDFEMEAIELETFSIARSVIGKKPGVFLVADVGSRATNLVLVENGIVIVNRTIDVGGNDITTTIAESLNISKQRAEMFKKEGKDFINERETAIVMPSLEFIGSEAKRIILAYKEKNRTSKVDALVLSGGTSELVGLDKYFKNMLGIEVFKSDPLAAVSYDPKIESYLKKIGPSFSVSIGLALRSIEDEYEKK